MPEVAPHRPGDPGRVPSPPAGSARLATAESADSSTAIPAPPCRSCGAPLERVVLDLGMSPLCESFVRPERLYEPEIHYPLDLRICDACLLVQLPVYVTAAEIFAEYAYFSSFSDSWVEHASRYVTMMIGRFGLDSSTKVIEVASNDGYLLQHVIAAGMDGLGIEPAGNIAAEAIGRGVPTINEFFTVELARRIVGERGHADLLIANNVFAHIPDLNDFTAGLRVLLAPGGVLTIEVAYLVALMEGNQFDTIYQEHFMYYTLHSAEQVLRRHGLRVFDVEELGTHGGSLRLFVVHDDDPAARATSTRVEALRRLEREWGFVSPEGYRALRPRAEKVKRDLLSYLITARNEGALVAGYGAPGKANTLLNYCGIRSDLIDFLVDRNPYKHGLFTPGTHIAIHPVSMLEERRPDVIIVMAWNLKDEIVGQLATTLTWSPRLVVAIPRLEVLG